MSFAPAPGTGKTRMADHVQLRLGILRGLSNFFEKLTGPDGALICPRHRVEHTGKIVYASVINLEAWRFTREEDYLERGKRQVLRAVDHLGLDPESRVPVFLPGRVDHRNASTNAIDGGACADAIATILEEVPGLLDRVDEERCLAALDQHVEGYLRHAARGRPITAQRLWAATGVARAARLMGRSDWADDALAGCASALEELSPDGVAPYIPAHTDHCTHPGLADTSTFYHSRTPGFVLYVHEVLKQMEGVDATLSESQKERVDASLRALIAFRDGLGHKVLNNEAKAWYWESDYEVASHPFDVYALQVGSRVLKEPLFQDEAGRAMESWIAHIDPLDGGADSHHGRGVNFQCRVFWSGHAAWIARVIDDVPVRVVPRDPVDVDLKDSGLLHVERSRYTAVLRGRTLGASNLFGCDLGGGSLQSLVLASDDRSLPVERMLRRRFGRLRPGSFLLRPVGAPGRLRNVFRVLREQRADLRFRLYVATIELKSRRGLLRGLFYPLRHILLRSFRDASPWTASHLDQLTVHAYDGESVLFEGALADRTGARVPGSRTVRRYSFHEDGVDLDDSLHLKDVRGTVRYLLPQGLGHVELSASGASLQKKGALVEVISKGGDVTLNVRGTWRADPPRGS
ncbi:MAG: hypothetical protein P8N09_10480 [Planctomycetota bacterium]|nr:hypothetical protein [Planctomycetota bacterium]